MDAALPLLPRRIHLTRLMSIWRSAGWPCRDAVELDLVAAGWATVRESGSGHETIRLTDAGIRLLAESPATQSALSDLTLTVPGHMDPVLAFWRFEGA